MASFSPAYGATDTFDGRHSTGVTDTRYRTIETEEGVR